MSALVLKGDIITIFWGELGEEFVVVAVAVGTSLTFVDFWWISDGLAFGLVYLVM